MNFNPIRPDAVKYELRYAGGVDPFMTEKKRPGGFGRFLSGIGRFFGAVAAPLSLVFPPAAIGAATMYGLGQVGDQVQYNAYKKSMQGQQGPGPMVIPGLETGPSAGGATSVSTYEESVMDVLYARNDMMSAQVKDMAKA